MTSSIQSTPYYHHPVTDHQVIRALSRSSQQDYDPSNQKNQTCNHSTVTSSIHSSNDYNPRSNQPLFHQLRSTTRKFVDSITHRSTPVPKTPDYPFTTENYNQFNRNHFRTNSPSSTDSIDTHHSNSSIPIRSKLGRKLSNISHRFNYHNHILNSSNFQSNSKFNNPRLNHDHHHHLPVKLRSSSASSSSSVSSFFEKSIVRALHNHPNSKTRLESPTRTPINPSLKSTRQPSPGPQPLISSGFNSAGMNATSTPPDPNTNNVSSPGCSTREDCPATVTRMTSRRNHDPRKTTLHTIYVPIEHDPTASISFTPNLYLNNPSISAQSACVSNKTTSRLDKRQSPTQIALSRLDEILRGHHRNESVISDQHELTDLNNHYKYQSIGGHDINGNAFTRTNSHPSLVHSDCSPSFSPLINLSPSQSLSPPLRTRKKNQSKPAHSHRHSQSLNDQHHNHVLIDPETWKSISISTSKFHPHRTLKIKD